MIWFWALYIIVHTYFSLNSAMKKFLSELFWVEQEVIHHVTLFWAFLTFLNSVMKKFLSELSWVAELNKKSSITQLWSELYLFKSEFCQDKGMHWFFIVLIWSHFRQSFRPSYHLSCRARGCVELKVIRHKAINYFSSFCRGINGTKPKNRMLLML